jgi:hypothetical protein
MAYVYMTSDDVVAGLIHTHIHQEFCYICYITPCCPLEVPSCSRLSSGSACYLFAADFFRSLYFDSEDGGEVSLRNVD